MKFLIALGATAIFFATAIQLYKLEIKKVALNKEYQKIIADNGALIQENSDLKKEIEYLGDTENLAREARSQFNYAKPNEKLIVVVPKE